MTPLAVALPTAASDFLLTLVIGLFWIYVPFCFILVTRYVLRQNRQGRLINTENAPLPLAVSGLSGAVFAVFVLALIFLQSPLFVILVPIGALGVLMETGRSATEQFGLARLRPVRLMSWSLLVFGAVMLVIEPLAGIVALLFDVLHLPNPEQETVIAFRHFNRASQILDFAFEAVLLSPMIEELFFRGFLLGFLKRYTSTWMALLLSSGVFAFAHANLGAALPLWFLGLALGLAYEHTGSLLLPMGIHACWNFVTALSLLLEKGN